MIVSPELLRVQIGARIDPTSVLHKPRQQVALTRATYLSRATPAPKMMVSGVAAFSPDSSRSRIPPRGLTGED
jgi:hypothetical protein